MSDEPRTPKVDVLERLLSVFTLEQLVMIADVYARIQARAIERGCRQGVEIVFNERGVPRFCNGTDAAELPKRYTPE